MRKVAAGVMIVILWSVSAIAQEFVMASDTAIHERIEEVLRSPAAATGGIPEGLALQQNYPNPFNPRTTIRYSLPHRGEVKLGVYDSRGNEVRIIVRGVQSAGSHMLRFDGSGLKSGSYHYRLEFKEWILSETMLLLK